MKCLLSIIYLSFYICTGQTINYKQIFGNDYTIALQLLKKNDSLFNKYAREYSIEEKSLKAIIFPELIRYNSIYDAIEITSLKYLYIKKGSYYNDFSVGYFQMKPSFAELLEKDANDVLEKSFLTKIGFDKLNRNMPSEDDREKRLIRITDVEYQLKYLVVFYKLCEKRFKDLHFKSEIDKLKFFATAYNSGYFKSQSVLESYLESKLFYTGKFNKSDTYNYASISSYFYSN